MNSQRQEEGANKSSLTGVCAVPAVGAVSAAGQGLGSVWNLGMSSPCSASPLLGALRAALLISPSDTAGANKEHNPPPFSWSLGGMVLSSDCPPHYTTKTKLSMMPL